MLESRKRVWELDGGQSRGDSQSRGSVRVGRWRLHPDRCNDVERVVADGNWNGGLDSPEPGWSKQPVDVEWDDVSLDGQRFQFLDAGRQESGSEGHVAEELEFGGWR